MPYEVSMSGGSPWGFRLAGGPFVGKPTTISRITPGGKAAQANVMLGDILIAVNGFSISHLDLPDLMNTIKLTGWNLHLTLISQDEIAQLSKKRQSEGNITDAAEIERPSSQLCRSTAAASPSNERENQITSRLSNRCMETPIDCPLPFSLETQEKRQHVECKVTVTKAESDSDPNRSINPKMKPPSPKPRRPKSTETTCKQMEKAKESTDVTGMNPESEKIKKIPDFVRRQLKPPKPLPEFKPQVHWLHDKLKITTKPQNGLKDSPGTSLKLAAAAYPSRRIEIDGPVSATIVHSQYNTPVGMYSANQIANTLVNTAAATGTKLLDSAAFGSQDVDVDRSTAVYRMVHHTDKPNLVPAQSKSLKIIEALLEHEIEIPNAPM